eukprot:3728169-Amphidinium_carterae.1
MCLLYHGQRPSCAFGDSPRLKGAELTMLKHHHPAALSKCHRVRWISGVSLAVGALLVQACPGTFDCIIAMTTRTREALHQHSWSSAMLVKSTAECWQLVSDKEVAA